MPADLAAMDSACAELGVLGHRGEATAGTPGPAEPLWNDNRAGGAGGEKCYERVKETPEQREIVLYRLLGFTAREIAEKVGYTPAGVNQVLRQPWARQRILDNLHKNHAQLQEMLQREAAECLLHQIELRDNPEVAPAVRNRICDSILDRALGKPMQSVDVTRRDAPPTESAEALQARLDKLRQEETALRGN